MTHQESDNMSLKIKTEKYIAHIFHSKVVFSRKKF